MTTAPLIQIDAEGTGPQMDFWHSPAAFRALSGGIGSGKTYAGAMECLMRPPGSVGMRQESHTPTTMNLRPLREESSEDHCGA